MRLMIAGGGTGGHIFPGIAVANAFVSQADSPRVLFVGSPSGLESKLVPAAGYNLYLIPAAGLKGKTFGTKVLGALKLPLGLVAAARAIISFSPDVVLGVGGYAAAAVCVMAKIFGVPVAIQEQNSVPGLTNRLLSRIAKKVFVAMPGTEKRLAVKKSLLTGNPIRSEILAVPKLTAANLQAVNNKTAPLQVLIFGGSQGAQSLNRGLMNALAELSDAPDLRSHLFFTHQTGERDFQSVKAAYDKAGFKADVRPFFDNMAEAYQRSHLIIARSGAGILEIAACGRGAILVPYPYAADDHQSANANVFEKAGAAIVVADRDFTGKRCAELIRELAKNSATLLKMGESAYSLFEQAGARQAAATIARHCIELGMSHAPKAVAPKSVSTTTEKRQHAR